MSTSLKKVHYTLYPLPEQNGLGGSLSKMSRLIWRDDILTQNFRFSSQE